MGAGTARAQSQGSGTILGRVYNPTDGEYVQDAEVRVQGTSLVTVSGDDGSYRLVNVPAGPATVLVSWVPGPTRRR